MDSSRGFQIDKPVPDRLNGQYTNINTRGNNGMSNYNALIASLAKQRSIEDGVAVDRTVYLCGC